MKINHNILTMDIPSFSYRINFGKEIKFLIEPGLFTSVILKNNQQGSYTQSVYKNGNFETQQFILDKTTNFDGYLLNVSLGLGIKIPVKNHEIILKETTSFSLNKVDFISNHYYKFSIGYR